MSASLLARSTRSVACRPSGFTASLRSSSVLAPTDTFDVRHNGPSDADIKLMLKVVGVPTLDALVQTTVPSKIRLTKPMPLEPARSETEALAHLEAMIDKNVLKKSFIGTTAIMFLFRCYRSVCLLEMYKKTNTPPF
jgi:hypothetical protein